MKRIGTAIVQLARRPLRAYLLDRFDFNYFHIEFFGNCILPGIPAVVSLHAQSMLLSLVVVGIICLSLLFQR